MMVYYLYQDHTIGIYEHRIDLLRNGFIYDKIEYPDIINIVIHKGLTRRWILLFSIGLGLIFLAFMLILHVYNNSVPSNFWKNLLLFWKGSKGSGFIAVIFLFAFGFYSIKVSLSKKILMTIESSNKKKQFEISEIFKEKKFNSMIIFLKDRVNSLIVDENINIS